jgi:hypothetical protein
MARRRTYIARGLRIPGVLSPEQTLRELTKIALSDGRMYAADAKRVSEGTLDPKSARRYPIAEKDGDRVKALELIGKAHMLFTPSSAGDLDRLIEAEVARITGRTIDVAATHVLPEGKKDDGDLVPN